MIIREIQRELEKDNIKVSSQSIRDLLRKKMFITSERKNETITFSDVVGKKIIEYYKAKNNLSKPSTNGTRAVQPRSVLQHSILS
jgi:hypothetical protein